MTKWIATLTVIGGLAATPGIARAQGVLLWFEGGQQQSSFASGLAQNGVAAGGGMNLTIGGSSKASHGTVLVVGWEGKFGRGADMVGRADVGLRVGSVSFGPGISAALMNRASASDASCLIGPVPDKSSCFPLDSQARGERDLGGFVAVAPSGFVKVSFGPQGRAFVQGRYIQYLPGLTRFESASELRDSFNVLAGATGIDTPEAGQRTETFHPVDFPEFQKGHDLRLGVGYVFGNAGGTMKLLRVEYSVKEFEFTRVLANTNGTFNQKANRITVGAGFGF